MTFEAVRNKHDKTLKLYVPIVARVHGSAHPEFLRVHELYNEIEKKVADSSASLEAEFVQLREVTDGYRVPDDVCESYEAVYVMLAELDAAYHS